MLGGIAIGTDETIAEVIKSQTELADPADWPVSAYREHYFALDPFVNLPIGKVVTLAELLPKEKMQDSEYYSQYLKPAGVYHIIGADIVWLEV